MGGQTSTLQHYLTLIASGQDEVTPAMLGLLSVQSVFLPVQIVQDNDFGVRAKLIGWRHGRRRIFPIFTSLKNFGDWDRGKSRCLALSGSDLAIVLPENIVAIFDPDRLSSLEIESELLRRTPQTSEGFPPRIISNEEINRLLHPPQAEGQVWSATQVISELKQLFNHYPEVEAGHFFAPSSPPAVMGLKIHELSPERRFLLLSEVGQIAMKYYGFVGAIEVFDDAGTTLNERWKILEGVAPFYQRNINPQEIMPIPEDDTERLSTEEIARRIAEKERRDAPAFVAGEKVFSTRKRI